MEVKLTQAENNEKHILKSLYSLYLHDLSEFTDGLHLSSDGSFEFDSFDLIWDKEGLIPYFIKNETEIVGFVLLLERPFLTKEYDYCINDFFILRKYRRKGVSKSSFRELVEQKQGKTVFVVLETNQPAVSFWRKTLTGLNLPFVEEKKVIDEEECLIFSFENKKAL